MAPILDPARRQVNVKDLLRKVQAAEEGLEALIRWFLLRVLGVDGLGAAVQFFSLGLPSYLA